MPAAPSDPVAGTPPRRPRSVRRTTSVDILRPDGMTGDVVLHGRARDLFTGDGGTTEVIAEAEVDARVRLADRVLSQLEVRPASAATAGLLGRQVGSGFRGAIDTGLAGSPTFVLLDDLPVATLISGYASLRVDDAAGAPDMARAAWAYAAKGDICSGWRSDGMMMRLIADEGRMPVPDCPPAPRLEDTTDLPPASMRRQRRIDVHRAGALIVNAMFRDSFWEADGTEVVLHEYRLDAVVDGAGVIQSVIAEPRVLPWPECPAAAASATRLVGVHVDDLPLTVKQDLKGISTCTHLNDLFRSLRDVHRLGARIT